MPMLLVIAAIIGCLSIDAIVPTVAYASTTATATDAYQLYDTRERTEQISVNKVWDDGLTNDARKYGNADYVNLLDMTIQTGVPQTALRTYTITYDANGGSFGTDANGNPITTNTITYNAKNKPTNGSPVTPERTEEWYGLSGWSTSKSATAADTSITLTNTVTDKWMNSRSDGSATTIYAVWQDLRVRYAVMAYGIGIDKDANGNTMGITFGPALGYPEFSPYNGTYTADSSSIQTFTKSHSVSGDATIMSESATACTDTSHSVITGTDAGTDAAGNAYRCLHYDNWATIIYWDEHDPHVYDKCIPNHCSKTVTITPNAGTIANGIFNTSIRDYERGLTGDGQSYILESKWDNQSNGVDITQAGQGYAASLVRAKLIGADSHTKLDDRYAGTNAMTKYTSESCILSCFPKNLRDAIGRKKWYDWVFMNHDMYNSVDDGAADLLWLFSYGEITGGYPSTGIADSAVKRSSMSGLLLREPYGITWVHCVGSEGDFPVSDTAMPGSVAPGFTLSGADSTDIGTLPDEGTTNPAN